MTKCSLCGKLVRLSMNGREKPHVKLGTSGVICYGTKKEQK